MNRRRIVWRQGNESVGVVEVGIIPAQLVVKRTAVLRGAAYGGQPIFGTAVGNTAGADAAAARFVFVVDVLMCVGLDVTTGCKQCAASGTYPHIFLVQETRKVLATTIPELSIGIAAVAETIGHLVVVACICL